MILKVVYIDGNKEIFLYSDKTKYQLIAKLAELILRDSDRVQSIIIK